MFDLNSLVKRVQPPEAYPITIDTDSEFNKLPDILTSVFDEFDIEPLLTINETGDIIFHGSISPSESVTIRTILLPEGRKVVDIRVELWASMEDDLPSRQNSTSIASIEGQDSEEVYFNWSASTVDSCCVALSEPDSPPM